MHGGEERQWRFLYQFLAEKIGLAVPLADPSIHFFKKLMGSNEKQL